MRDLILLLALLGIGAMTIRVPLIGLLAWIWVSVMNPQREVYGFLSGAQINVFIALLTAASWIASKERKTLPSNATTGLLLTFMAWTWITTLFALNVHLSEPLWERTAKSIVLALAVATLVNSASRAQAIVWAIVISLGYFAVEGAGIVIASGGQSKVFGPEDSMIADNNQLGLALVVMLPLMNYLRVTSKMPIVRLTLLASIGLAVIAIFGTYSRGALLALGVTVLANAVRSKSGLVLLFIGAVILVSAPSFLPQAWVARMQSIQSYSKDDSFAGRVAAWKTSINVVKARPLVGGGFASIEDNKTANDYSAPGSLTEGKAAHSIYFEVLGDHGIPGLVLYLLIVGSALLNTRAVIKASSKEPTLEWANRLAKALQVSLLALLVGGAALSMAYYDVFLVLMGLTAALALTVKVNKPSFALSGFAPKWKRTPAFN